MTPQQVPAAPERVVAPLDTAPFGINTHLATRYPDPTSMNIPADLVQQSGAGWAREDIHWYRIQPDPDTWDWTFTDQAMRELIKRQINIVGVLGHPPGWATPSSADESSGVSFYAPDPQRFAAFAEAVVKRYGRYVQYWEIWNEPDNPLFWKPAPDPARYALMLKLTARAIRRASPEAKVLIGGFNPFNMEFMREVAEHDTWNSFDIIAIHPYVDPMAPEEANISNVADGPRALAAQYGDKPIWVTEIGWASGPGDRDPQGLIDAETQANNLVRAMLLLWHSGVERIFWYTLKDDPGNPYGLIAQGRGYADYSTPKPAFYAFRTLSQQIGGAEFVALRDLFERTMVLDFELFGSWHRGDQPYGEFSSSTEFHHTGAAAARLDYHFPSSGNDFLVFRRDRPAPISGPVYALGLWVYGDGSGNTLKIWLRDAEDEVLQYTLGTVGPAGWRLLHAPIAGTVPSWNRITPNGDGQLDLPARVDGIVLDDAPDSFSGSGTLYLDDLIALSGPEAYNLQLRHGNAAVDIVWAPEPVRARIRSAAATADLIAQDGTVQTVPVNNAKIVLDLGPAPIFIRHAR